MGVAKYIKNEKDGIDEVIYQSGMRVKPVYTPQDLDDVGFDCVRLWWSLFFRCPLDALLGGFIV